MKILISASYYFPHISGLTNATKNLAELLGENGYKVTILTTQHDKHLPEHAVIRGVAVQRVAYLLKISKGFLMPGFLFVAYRAIRESDRVIINLPQPEGYILALLAKFLKKKLICIYHCDVEIGLSLHAKVLTFFLRSANKISLSLADTVITTSDDFAKHSSLLTSYAGKSQTIPLVMQAPVIIQSAEEAIAKKLLPKRKYVIGFVGRIAAEKGIGYLVDAIPLLQKKLGNDFIIVLAGPMHVVGEKRYLAKITHSLMQYKENVIMLGELKQNELGAFYHLLDVLVLPSSNPTEAFGMVQVEAMLCGTPVVASDLPGVRVPIHMTGMGEIVKPGNQFALAEGIVKVVQNKKAYKKNKVTIEKQFDKAKILSAYRKLLG